MSSEKNHTLPISTAPHQSTTSDDGNNEGKSAEWAPPATGKLGRRLCILSASFCAVVLVIIAMSVLVVSFTVYKVREPTMRLNAINFNQLDLTQNLTVVADVSVKNPNSVTFKFNSSTTSLLYRSKEVGSANGPPETVGAHKTLRTNVTVQVITDRLLDDPHFMDDVQNGSLGLQTCTMVEGKAKILGMFKRHVGLMMNCTVKVSIETQAILDQHCTQHMWL